jgi:putative DNA primase/helicase
MTSDTGDEGSKEPDDHEDRFSCELDGNLPEIDSSQKSKRGVGADWILSKILQELELWHTPNGTPYATVDFKDHSENWPIESSRFEKYVRWRAFELGERLAGSSEIDRVIGGLCGWAINRGKEFEVFSRVGEKNGRIYVDLGDSRWRCVEIWPMEPERDERWRILSSAPIKFVRRPTMRPMAEPRVGGSIDLLRRYLNVETEGDFRLAIGAMISSFRPQGPYHTVCISGTQGSGKSTVLRVFSRLCDPVQAPERNLPKDERDLFVAAASSHLQTFDNLSGINAGMSDALCRIATGAGFSVRALHTNGEEYVIQVCKPIVANGIGDLARRGDLADRSIQINAAQLTAGKRRAEADFWADFEQDEPEILGVLLDAVSWALSTQASTPAPQVRMSDSARFMEAAAPSLGWEKGTFVKLLQANRVDANDSVIEADLVAMTLIKFLDEKDGNWRGTAMELLTALTDLAPERIRRAKFWPINGSGMAAALNRIKDALETRGYAFERGHEGPKRERRYIQFSRSDVG